MTDFSERSKLLAEMDRIAQQGYTIALHIEFSQPRFLFQTYDPAWSDLYTDRGFILQDPTVHWALQNLGSVRWSEIDLPDPAGVFAEAAKFGLKYGVCVSIQTDGSHSLANCAHSKREYTRDEISLITEVVENLHAETLNTVELTQIEKAVLKEIAKGKRQADAARAMNIPYRTFKSHLASARNSLNVRTTAEAVQKAIQSRLIH